MKHRPHLPSRVSCLFYLVSVSCCAPHAVDPPGHAAQAVPARAADAADSASRVRGASEAVDRSAAGIEVRAATLSRESRNLREALGELSRRADVLRKQVSTTAEEKAELWERLTDISRRALLLEDEAAAAVKALDEQRELRRLAAEQITAMEAAARNKDQEAGQLRMQLGDESARALANHTLATGNAAAARKAAKDADHLRGQRKVWIGLSIIIIAVAGGLFWLTSINPLAVFRR